VLKQALCKPLFVKNESTKKYLQLQVQLFHTQDFSSENKNELQRTDAVDIGWFCKKDD
jgi:hypothetical protein